jgi:hypothetical protein
MTRFTIHACAALLALAFGWSGSARAQNSYPFMPPQYGPGYQTMLSPYLNFLRGGDPAANYFLGVLPEFQRRENRNQFRGQIGALQIVTAPLRNPLEEPLSDVPTQFANSGHPTAFGYTGTFFGGTGGASPLGGPRGQPQRQGGGQAARQYAPLGGGSPPPNR